MSALVYCKNCKYDSIFMPDERVCNYKHLDGEFINSTHLKYKRDLNLEGQCEFYRWKWWKVWIKK